MEFEDTNAIEATSDEAKDMLGRLDKTINGIIGEFVKEETDLHEFQVIFKNGVSDQNKKAFKDIVFEDLVGVMDRAFDTLVYANQKRLSESEKLEKGEVSEETIQNLKNKVAKKKDD